MKAKVSKKISIILVLVLGSYAMFSNIPQAEGLVTGGKFFCEAFPTYPECTGWRVEPIFDNYWFCEYLDLPTMCKFKPNPQKQIQPLEIDECCREFEAGKTIDRTSEYVDPKYEIDVRIGKGLPEAYPVDELAIWTDKDHYLFGDKVNVYGKFDFGDPIIKDNNELVDIRFNEGLVIPDLPIDENGWFSGFFRISDSRYFHTGLSQVSVEYFHKATIEEPDKFTRTTYQFTTGNIPLTKGMLDIIVEQNPTSDSISYEITSERKIISKPESFILRITNPNNVSFPLPTLSMNNLENYLDEVSDVIPGKYTISVTVGEFMTEESFEIQDSIENQEQETLMPDEVTSDIPDWVKNNAAWWSSDLIDDELFVQGMQYLIQEGIMEIPSTIQGVESTENEIPSWVRNNAAWWSSDLIDDELFVQGMQYLIQEGIMTINR